MISYPNAVLDSLSDEVRRIVLEEIGAERVRAIIVTGSAAREAVSSWSDGEHLEVYSDLDVAVVLAGADDLDAVRESVRRRVADIDLDRGQWRVFSAPDVGVFTMADLARQPARPGTVDIGPHHRTIYGDPAVAEAARWSPGDIRADEALYLLENRMLESCAVRDSLRPGRDEGRTRYAHYTALKGALDVASAVLITAGRYSTSREERMREFLSAGFLAEQGDLLPPGAADLVSACHEALLSLGETVPSAQAAGAELCGRVNELMVEVWQRITRRLRGTPDADWTELVMWRAEMSRRRCVRALITLARRRSVSLWRAMWWVGANEALSPVTVLRLCGFLELIGERADPGPVNVQTMRSVCRALDRLTSAFGFVRGTVFERARAMYEAVT